MEATLKTTTCKDCGETEEYMDDGITLSCMPDGVLVEDNGWVCSECGEARGLFD